MRDFFLRTTLGRATDYQCARLLGGVKGIMLSVMRVLHPCLNSPDKKKRTSSSIHQRAAAHYYGNINHQTNFSQQQQTTTPNPILSCLAKATFATAQFFFFVKPINNRFTMLISTTALLRWSHCCIVVLFLLFGGNDGTAAAFVPRSSSVGSSNSRVIAFFPRRKLSLSSLSISASPSVVSAAAEEEEIPTLPFLYPLLSSSLTKLGFSKPTPIQIASSKALLSSLSSTNLLLIAPTGSGKTLAYLLPALSTALLTGSTVLVVAPTRELAVQLLRDANDLVSNLEASEQIPEIVLAVRGVELPTTEQLRTATLMIGTPPELLQVAKSVRGGRDFIAGDVLSTVVLDEVDVLLPQPPKILRTALDNNGGKKNNRKTPQDERRKQEQKRKRMAMKRRGIELSDDSKQIVSPTEQLLRFVATNRYFEASPVPAAATTTPFQVLAGSATASRKTLDRLNRVLRSAAGEASSTHEDVWYGDVKPCRPSAEEGGSDEKDDDDNSIGDGENHQKNQNEKEAEAKEQPQPQQQHTIRAVTVPREVNHRYILCPDDDNIDTTAGRVLAAVAKATTVLKPKTALLFICGELGKSNAKEKQRTSSAKKAATSQARRKQVFRQKRLARAKQKEQEKNPAAAKTVLSARKACSTLSQYGIDAQPLHVALGLELHSKDNKDDDGDGIPPFLVTFEGSARGLHFDGIDAVFVVGRPSSAASYLHLAGRVGRASTSANGEVEIRPGTVVSVCHSPKQSKELAKWTQQIGGTELTQLDI